MTEHYKRIAEFMKLAKQPVRTRPELGSLAERKLRAKLILEEVFELVRDGLGLDSTNWDNMEMLYEVHEGNLTALADGCGDLSVVNIGTLVQFGIDDEPLLKLIDHNNLNKFGPGHSLRPDGKLVKPPNHEPPAIDQLIRQLGRTEPERGDLVWSKDVPFVNGVGIVHQVQSAWHKITRGDEVIEDQPEKVVALTVCDFSIADLNKVDDKVRCVVVTDWKLIQKRFVIQGIEFRSDNGECERPSALHDAASDQQASGGNTGEGQGRVFDRSVVDSL